MHSPAPATDPYDLVAPHRGGSYAGFVTRGVAYVADTAVIVGGFTAAMWGGAALIGLLTGRDLDPSPVVSALSATALAMWALVYTSYTLVVFNRTPGMWFMGIRVVRRDGSQMKAPHAVARAIVAPVLQVMTIGLDVLWIAVSPTRRAWHDHICGTAVVYDWEAHAAPMRFPAVRSTAGGARSQK